MHSYGAQINDLYLSINCTNFIFKVLVSFMSGGNTVSQPVLLRQLRMILKSCLTEIALEQLSAPIIKLVTFNSETSMHTYSKNSFTCYH